MSGEKRHSSTCGEVGYCNGCTPTPEPSEVAETTAGEREVGCPKHPHWSGMSDDCAFCAPAEPDAGEVEACPVKWCAYPMPHDHTEGSGPTFDALLSDPTQQLDSEGVVLASIVAHHPEPRRLTIGELEWLDDSMMQGFDNLILTVERLMERAADEVRPTPVRPDAGDVETLAEAIWNAMPAHHVGWRGLKGDSRDFYLGIAERLMPTLDRERREVGERIAQAIATSVSPGFGLNHDGSEDSHAMAYVEGLKDAHDIARDEAAR